MFTNDVHNATQGFRSNGDLDRGASVQHGLAADETLSTVHGNGTNSVLS